jgi:hypothetical protein
MKKLLLIALASTLVASGANAEWKYVEKVDEMTGKTKAIILSEQRNRAGAVAYVTADCKAPEEIVFAALFTDEQGEPIKLSNLKFHEEAGRWRVQVGRYRIDDQIGFTNLQTLEYKNRVQVLAVATESAMQQFEKLYGGSLAWAAINGTHSILPVARYKNIKLVKAEFITEFGEIVVTIDTTDANVQRLYNSCFGSE